jgi:hypothetical protein
MDPDRRDLCHAIARAIISITPNAEAKSQATFMHSTQIVYLAVACCFCGVQSFPSICPNGTQVDEAVVLLVRCEIVL